MKWSHVLPVGLAALSVAAACAPKSRPVAPYVEPSPPRAPRPLAGMTNEDVMEMVAAGLAEDAIVTAIRQAPVRSFDLGADGLIALKQGNVSDAIILTMQAPEP